MDDIWTQFAIISNNCWGGGWYRQHGRRYNTPFIGLFLFAADYIQLMENFFGYIDLPLKIAPSSRYGKFGYPVGLLGDLEIHFLHYNSWEESYEKWTRRVKRLPRDPKKWLIKSDNRDGCTPEMMERFSRLPFPHKISFSQSTFSYPKSRENWHHVIIPDANIMYPDTPKSFNVEAYINHIIME